MRQTGFGCGQLGWGRSQLTWIFVALSTYCLLSGQSLQSLSDVQEGGNKSHNDTPSPGLCWERPQGPPDCVMCSLSVLVQNNIQKMVRTLWQQLVAQRRQELEDTFKIDLSVKPGESEVKIEEITPLWEETMLKAWQHYLGLCPLGFREQNCWVSQMQNFANFLWDQSLFQPDLLWCMGFTSLKLHESLLTKNKCRFVSWVKGRSEILADSSNFLERVDTMSKL